ncbi:hypothetical protein MDA_GLEAN10013481 [Myotis davidii]|uniref:Uncharacterized protein n=1 Tax=Myotis davidii TaxID=225400 RepID=L5LUX1_MYODS|nr:hypothetical protein MDA_GLEAN10013481 [Myotis davidii]
MHNTSCSSDELRAGKSESMGQEGSALRSQRSVHSVVISNFSLSSRGTNEASGGSRARVHGQNKITCPLAGAGQLIMAQKCTIHPVAPTSYEHGRVSPWDRRDRLFEAKGRSIAL